MSLTNINITIDSDNLVKMTPTHTSVAVATTSTSVLAENLNRKYVLIANTSDSTIYISLNGVATTDKGIPINAGGNYEMSANYISTGEISAIHTGIGVKNIFVTEGI